MSTKGKISHAQISPDGRYAFFILDSDEGSFIGASSTCNLSDASFLKVSPSAGSVDL